MLFKSVQNAPAQNWRCRVASWSRSLVSDASATSCSGETLRQGTSSGPACDLAEGAVRVAAVAAHAEHVRAGIPEDKWLLLDGVEGNRRDAPVIGVGAGAVAPGARDRRCLAAHTCLVTVKRSRHTRSDPRPTPPLRAAMRSCSSMVFMPSRSGSRRPRRPSVVLTMTPLRRQSRASVLSTSSGVPRTSTRPAWSRGPHRRPRMSRACGARAPPTGPPPRGARACRPLGAVRTTRQSCARVRSRRCRWA